jgi:hypothetical protein
MMKPSSKPWIVLLVAAVSPLVARAAPPPPGPAIDPRADQELRRMSSYLAGLDRFRVTSTAVDEVVTTSGQKLQQVSTSQVSLKRPNRLRSDRVGPFADMTFRYDGRSFSLYGKRTGMYALAPAPATLDGAIDVARDQYGLDAPGADLLLSRPYDVLMDGVTDGTYVGLEPIDGVPCHHLAFRGQDVDWQIWIQDGPEPLPRRYVITSKTVPGSPEFTVRLANWEPHAPLADQLFEFTPPPGATRIQFLAPHRASR